MNNLAKGRELEMWVPEVEGENLRAKPAKSDSNKEAAVKPGGVLRPQEWPWNHWQLVCGDP